jgi:hypothetical protein
MTTFIERILRALKLDAQVYEEIEADKSATIQAVLVIVLSSMAGGFGSIFRFGVNGIFTGFIMALIAWLVWVYIIYLVGTKILPEAQTQADPGQVLRTTGFASAPGILSIAGMVPLLENFVAMVVSLWMLVAMVVAVKQVLDYTSTLRAIAVCVIGWIVYLFVVTLFMTVFGGF